MATKPKTKPKTKPIFAIVRCNLAGVHAGEVISRKSGILTLRNSRRLWRWWSKATLSELSQEGPVNVADNRYGCVLPLIYLTESDVGEVIPCTDAAKKAILAVPIWSNK